MAVVATVAPARATTHRPIHIVEEVAVAMVVVEIAGAAVVEMEEEEVVAAAVEVTECFQALLSCDYLI